MNEVNCTSREKTEDGRRALTTPLLHITQRNASRKLLALMALGNPSFLASQMDACITKQYAEALSNLASGALTQAKYQGIAFTNLACRTALEAGVSQETVHSISGVFSARYATLTDPSEQWAIARELLLSFSSAIRDVNLSPYSHAVRQCCEYIDEMFFTSTSLNDLGQMCGLSAHYVSDLFRRELGMGALQYIHQVKLQYAKYLLEHSELSIAELSALLSYPSHSNFSQQFKKTYGITPHEYRTLFT